MLPNRGHRRLDGVERVVMISQHLPGVGEAPPPDGIQRLHQLGVLFGMWHGSL